MCIVLLTSTNILCADKHSNLGLLYPKAHGPYQGVFKTVINGIEQQTSYSVKKLMIESNSDLAAADKWITENNIEVLVSLGKQGLDLCKNLSTDVQLIAGAILTPPGEECQIHSGIALAPDPEKLFNWLKRLSPTTKEIHVVYNSDFNEWLIKLARKAAEKQGLLLHTYQASAIGEAAKQYRDIVNAGLGRGQAIWLPQDPYTVDHKTVLPALLRDSWDKDFIVFSSNAAHVKRGVLFGLYPDFEAMGASLGKMAKRIKNDSSVKKAAIQPLNDVLIAVNLRTADHLKLNLKSSDLDAFDLTFPASR